jgi:hypothetical protein
MGSCYTFTVQIMNDTDTPAKFYLGNVSAGGDLPADEAILTMPSDGMDTVIPDAQSQTTLSANGWVNFASMMTR